MADNHFKINRGLSLLGQTSAPSNPVNGDMYYNSSTNKFMRYEAGAWIDFSAITALTGDGTASGSGSVPFTLATVNSNVGTFGNATNIPTVTVNAKGLVTAVSTNAISAISALTGDGTASGNGSVSFTLATVNSNVGTFGSTTTVPVVTVNAKGLVTAVSTASISSGGITALTGDGTASGSGSVSFTLATVNSNVGTFGTSTAIPVVTVNAKGLVTAVSTTSVTVPAGINSAKTANYPLTNADDVVTFDTTAGGGNLVATLFTAVGNSGKIVTISKVDTHATRTVAIATTSSQTVGGRASSDILLLRFGDMVRVQSDGANWIILDKREYKVLTSAPGAVAFPNNTNTNYVAATCTVTLTYGIWRVRGHMGVNIGGATAANVSVASGSGFYGADGANNTSVPTALGGTISGDVTWASQEVNFIYNGGGDGANTRHNLGSNEIIISVTSSTPIYLVPKVEFNGGTQPNITPYMVAERVY